MSLKFLRIIFFSLGTFVFPSIEAQQLPFDWSISEADSLYDERTGESDAKAYLRLGDMVVLVPGNPPVKLSTDIREKEYRRFGVEWRNTGDVSTSSFEAYRKGFNRVMEIAIKKRFGDDFFDKTEQRIANEIQKASRAGKR